MKQADRLLAGLAGAGLCFSLWWGFAGTREEGVGSGWTLGRPVLVLSSAALSGPLRNDPASMDLSGNRAAEAPSPLRIGTTLTLDATLPDGGQLLLRTGRVPRGSAAPQHGPGGPAGAGPGGNGPIARDSGAGGDDGNDESSPTLTFDRGPSAALHGTGGLVCDPLPILDGALHATVKVAPDGATVRVGDHEARCSGRRLEGPWMLRSGVERIHIAQVTSTTPSGTTVLLGSGPWYTRAWAGVLAAALGGLAAAFAPLPRSASAALIPLALSPLFALVRTGRWLESMRLLEFPEALVPMLAGAIPSAIAAIFLVARRHTLRNTLLVGAAPLLVSLTLWLRYRDARGWSLLAAAFIPLAALTWANVRKVRGLGLWSWAAVLLMLGLAETGVRQTRVGDTWVRTAGYERAAKEFQELLELRQYRTYPSEGFPVKPPEPRPGVHRIVAFGGSSTGGAFQMDNIDLFWPKKLEDQLASPDWEVVNQGVGGWNTLHIRLYAESQLARLAPEIVVLYVGHNDLMSGGAATHKTLLSRYQAPPNATFTAVDDALNASRLFVGFKFLLLSWRGDSAAAVPLTDARENLEEIITLSKAIHAHVLLVSEGMNPDAAPMVPYAKLEAEIAAATGERAFDAAGKFAKEADPDDFLDDCHLTIGGHERLASWVLSELRAAGWVAGGDAPPAH